MEHAYELNELLREIEATRPIQMSSKERILSATAKLEGWEYVDKVSTTIADYDGGHDYYHVYRLQYDGQEHDIAILENEYEPNPFIEVTLAPDYENLVLSEEQRSYRRECRQKEVTQDNLMDELYQHTGYLCESLEEMYRSTPIYSIELKDTPIPEGSTNSFRIGSWYTNESIRYKNGYLNIKAGE